MRGTPPSARAARGRSSRTRAALLVVVTGLGLVAAPRAAAAAPTLAGTTVVSGGGVHAMRVRVPRAATLSLRSTVDGTQGESARFRGGGRLLALGLVAEPREDETWLMRSSICATRGCTSPWRPFFAFRYVGDVPQRGQTTLRAGTYTLYWVADGGSASVTLTLAGLSGRRTLRPPATRGALWSPAQTASTVAPGSPVGARVYAGSTDVVLDRPGAMLSVTWIGSSVMTMRENTCLVARSPAPNVGPCQPPTIGVAGGVSELVWPSGRGSGGIGRYAWTVVPPGTYTLHSDAQFAGKFGHAGLTTVILPRV